MQSVREILTLALAYRDETLLHLQRARESCHSSFRITDKRKQALLFSFLIAEKCMNTNEALYFREQLTERRQRLERALAHSEPTEGLTQLLEQIDAALHRIEVGTYGLCEACHDPIEHERLLIDPLLRNCLDHLTPREQRALERDLDLAFHIQQGLLPKADIQHGNWVAAYRYEPAGPVSGDYCDVLLPENEKEAMMFFVGDVAGKGVAASILMGHLHAMFRSLATAQLPLNELIARANRIFCEGTLTAHYATLISGVALADGRVELCNAGHPPVFVVGRDGVRSIDSTAPPIGLFCTIDFPTLHVHVARRERLVVYSDGVTEAQNAAGEQFGEERLRASLARYVSLPPKELIEACLDEVRVFRSGRAMDDVTMFVLERR